MTRVTICGTDLLVSTRSSWEECPVVRPVSFLYAGCFSLLETGRNEDDVARILAKALKRSPESIKEKTEKIFADLYQIGFLIKEEDENEPD